MRQSGTECVKKVCLFDGIAEHEVAERDCFFFFFCFFFLFCLFVFFYEIAYFSICFFLIYFYLKI